MILSLDKFLRRFLLHILPQGFVRIRNFVFLANRRRATVLPLCFHLLGSAQQPQTEQNVILHQRLFQSLALPQVRWPDEGRRAAYGCSNPTSLSAGGHRGSMKALSPIRLLFVPRRGSHLSAWPSDYSLLSASSTTFFMLLFRRNELLHAALRWCTPALGRGEPPRRSFPSLNFYRARVRRKPGGHVLSSTRLRTGPAHARGFGYVSVAGL